MCDVWMNREDFGAIWIVFGHYPKVQIKFGFLPMNISSSDFGESLGSIYSRQSLYHLIFGKVWLSAVCVDGILVYLFFNHTVQITVSLPSCLVKSLHGIYYCILGIQEMMAGGWMKGYTFSLCIPYNGLEVFFAHSLVVDQAAAILPFCSVRLLEAAARKPP